MSRLDRRMKASAAGKKMTVWYGGDPFFGRKRYARMRSPPYAASNATVCFRQISVSSVASTTAFSGARS